MILFLFKSIDEYLKYHERGQPFQNGLCLYVEQEQEQGLTASNLNLFHVNHFTRKYATKIRQRAIYLLDELGESHIGSKSLYDFLLYQQDFSLWSTSILAEKNLLFGSISFANALKLVTLEIIFTESIISSVWTSIQDQSFIHPLQALCASHQIPVRLSTSPQNVRRSLSYSPLDLAIASAKAIKLLVSELALAAICRLATKHHKQSSPRPVPGKHISIYSYLPSINKLTDSDLHTSSDYLGNLPQTLLDEGYTLDINYVNTLSVNIANLHQLCRSQSSLANQSQTNTCMHQIAHNSLCLSIITKLAWDYLSFIWKLTRIFKQHGSLEISSPNYLALVLKKEILSSLIGPHLVKSLLNWHMFDHSISTLSPSATLLLYLHEGSSWEKTLLTLWKKHHPSGTSVGFIHSSVRFWDLRLFDAIGIVDKPNRARNLAPDILAITSDRFRRLLVQARCPSEIRLVESLRHQYLYKSNSVTDPKSQPCDAIESKVILVIGDYSQSKTLQLLRAVQAAILKLPTKYHILFKPHPKSPELPNLLSHINGTRITTQNIVDSSRDVLFAICTDSTSAIMDLQILNKEVFIYILPGSLGLPPILSQESTTIVHSPNELANYMKKSTTAKRPTIQAPISCSSSCKLWLKLLSRCFSEA